VCEVLVQRAAADLRGLADVADVGGVKAALGEHPLRACEDLTLAGFGSHVTHCSYTELTCQFSHVWRPTSRVIPGRMDLSRLFRRAAWDPGLFPYKTWRAPRDALGFRRKGGAQKARFRTDIPAGPQGPALPARRPAPAPFPRLPR